MWIIAIVPYFRVNWGYICEALNSAQKIAHPHDNFLLIYELAIYSFFREYGEIDLRRKKSRR